MISLFEKNGFIPEKCTYSDLDIFRRGNVLLISMKKFKKDKKASRIAANHFDRNMLIELNNAFSSFETDKDIKSIILASGHKVAFSRGARIELLLELSTEEIVLFIEGAQKFLLQVQQYSKPVIAAISGLALGGGLELAMGCDYRISSDRENVIMGLPETFLGIIPAMGGTQNLPGLIGREKAFNIITEANVEITPRKALDWGLVDAVVDEDSLVDEAFRIANTMNIKKHGITGKVIKTGKEIQSEIDNYLKETKIEVNPREKTAPLARSLVSFIFSKTSSENYLEALLYEKEIFVYLSGTSDCREGITALNEERAPVFRGK